MIWTCKKCKVHWHYQVEKCIYCGGKTTKLEPKKFKVIASTQVMLPSVEHSAVPYYSLILEDEFGFRHTHKTNEKYGIGDVIEKSKKKESNGRKLTIGLVGTGALGKDIAKVMLQSGFKLIIKSRDKDGLKTVRKKIEEHLLKSFGVEEKEKLMKNLKLTTNTKDLKNADFVLEAVVENLEIKKKVFKDLEAVCGKKTIFATNTSSLSIDELASDLKNPERVVGMHFFNPATKMRLVEVIKGSQTNPQTMQTTNQLVADIHKISVSVKDSPAFIANRILMPYLNEAIIVLEEGIATKEDIDTTAKLALNHPMGPLQLLDLIGLDVFVEIMKNLHKATKNPKYLPANLATQMVAEGKLGRKTKQGFYKY